MASAADAHRYQRTAPDSRYHGNHQPAATITDLLFDMRYVRSVIIGEPLEETVRSKMTAVLLTELANQLIDSTSDVASKCSLDPVTLVVSGRTAIIQLDQGRRHI